MSVLYIMLPVAVALAGGGVWMFIRAVRGGQFDDLETPALRVLADDEHTGAASDQHTRRGQAPRT